MGKPRDPPETILGQKIDLMYPEPTPLPADRERGLAVGTVGDWRKCSGNPKLAGLRVLAELSETPLVYWVIDAIQPVRRPFVEASIAVWCLQTLGIACVRRPAIGDGSLLVCEPDPGEIERAAAGVERRLAAAMQVESGQELVQKILECADVALQLREAAETFGNQLRALQGRPPDE